jgi:hypothetical protein
MRRLWPLPLACLLLAHADGAELYRCSEAGVMRFVDDPAKCEQDAEPHALSRELHVPSESPAAPDADERAPVATRTREGLEALLPLSSTLAGGWEPTYEAPDDPADDPDLVRWGVAATAVRHYGRGVGPVTEVCSVEIWAFRSEQQASAAGAGFAYPGWQIERRGDLLVMARGTRWRRGGAFEKGMFPACREIASRVKNPA